MLLCSLEFGDTHAEQSEYAQHAGAFRLCQMLWEDPLLQGNKEVIVQDPFQYILLSDEKTVLLAFELNSENSI